MKKLYVLLAAAISTISASSYASSNVKTSAEYHGAYQCASDAIAHHDVDAKDGANGMTTYCIGNSHDPSRVELQAFKDAIRDSRSQVGTQTTGPIACTFAYALYDANGSHADGFLEGRQTIHTLKEVAWAIQAHQVALFDRSNRPIPSDVASHWFISKNGTEWKISPEARKTCSRQQLG
ncbi:hypothetical protein [Burkholderia sp. Ax-1719]|uniref:hypothetical protein n=1 Tax=Burkholderia sp. Ax-1719 TaxID=2608334 RepID=UPI001420F0F0|nr:hypothetical protein [Burkholderia sp. Ax-1719]NIE63160.1 hypothetical protein [Burkholderia sp. Ax-1719]